MRHLDADFPLTASRRGFLQAISLAATTVVLPKSGFALAARWADVLTSNSAADAETHASPCGVYFANHGHDEPGTLWGGDCRQQERHPPDARHERCGTGARSQRAC